MIGVCWGFTEELIFWGKWGGFSRDLLVFWWDDEKVVIGVFFVVDCEE